MVQNTACLYYNIVISLLQSETIQLKYYPIGYRNTSRSLNKYVKILFCVYIKKQSTYVQPESFH